MTDDQRKKIVEMLSKSYNMEVETVCNYLANSIHLDGVMAEPIRETLAEEVEDELGHAKQLANRIKVLGGKVPGSMDLLMEQGSLQPPENSIDIASVIKGTIEAEAGAVEQYQKIIEFTDGVDLVTQDMCIGLKAEEEEHRRMFEGFLKEVEHLQSMHRESSRA